MSKRQIAIFTDSHALLEPTIAILEDIKKRGITEIYSLGDNIGVGPNPSELMNILEEYNVKSISGNYEYYISLGIEPFKSYFNKLKESSYLWTLSKLNEHRKGIINLYPSSFQLLFANKKIALCHFANDIRFDYSINSTWTYQENIKSYGKAYEQFLYTNNRKQLLEIKKKIKLYGIDNPMVKGYLSALKDPLFTINGIRKKIDFFDTIIEGHVHFKLYEENDKTKFYTIRSVGMGYGKDLSDTASYVILKENDNDYDFQEILVKYDRDKMINFINNSDNPDKETIKKFTNL